MDAYQIQTNIQKIVLSFFNASSFIFKSKQMSFSSNEYTATAV
jgi:hypothetical protein